MRPRSIPLALLSVALLSVALLACRSERAGPAPSSSASAASSAPQPAPEQPFLALQGHWGEQASALAPLASTLVASVEKISTDPASRAEALRDYAAFRSAYRRLEPLTRVLAGVASSQIGAYAMIDLQESGPTGLPALGRALREPTPDLALLRTLARRVHNATRLLPGELATQSWTLPRVGLALSDGVFTLGARLDGSDSFDEQERWTDVAAELDGLLLAIEGVLPLIRRHDPAAAQDVEREREVLRKFHTSIPAAGAAGSPGTLAILAATGRLGAALRRGLGAAGAGVIPPPFRAMHDRGFGNLAPVSVLTFPSRTGPTPDPAEVALGRALFASKLLSRDRSIACASCHDEAHAFARPDPPTLTFERKAPPRNAPGLLNVAYETFFFWDGRASTLEAQIDTAVDRDMGGDWTEVERRLNADETLRPLHPEPLTAARVRKAIVAYERTLIEDATRLDRHERGELVLEEPEQRGFELFFGKARCSRCHRLPLLSGVQPPRLRRTELSAIGAPTSPGGKDAGKDTGRHGTTHHEEDRGLFKVPGLRRVAETAPYFHHGGFKTLAQVLDFYEKGGGPGLGVPTPNADPELAPLRLSPAERADLLVFLQRSLGR